MERGSGEDLLSAERGGGGGGTSPGSQAPAGSASPRSQGSRPEPPASQAAALGSSPGQEPAGDKGRWGCRSKGSDPSRRSPHPRGLTKHCSSRGPSAWSSWQDCSKKWSQKWARHGGPPWGSGVGLKCWYSRKVSIMDTRYLRAQPCLQLSQAPASTARETGLNGGSRCHGHWFGRDRVFGSGFRPVGVDAGAESTRLKRRPLTRWGH